MKDRDFVFTGLQPWDIATGSNAIDIAKKVAEQNRVLYVNCPLDIMSVSQNLSLLENKKRVDTIWGKKKPLRKITESLWVLDLPFAVWPVNKLPDGAVFDFFNKLNNKKIFKYTNKVIFKLGFKDIIHFIDNDIYRSFFSKEYLKPTLSVYYRRDNLLSIDFWKKHACRLEPLLISKSDLVVCNSPQLAEFAKKYNPCSHNVGQGLDLSLYDKSSNQTVPKDLVIIPEPRIGYIGNITSMRLDADLIYQLANSKPEYSFVMVGGEDNYFSSHLLHELKNVHFLGSVSTDEVPSYISALQVCMNPQLINELTIGNYPRKVDEYLAMGKPVIATKTATMELFKDYVYLCSTLSDYQDAVEKAIVDNSEEIIKQRIQFARSHSWENNVNEIYKQIMIYFKFTGVRLKK